MKIARSSTMAWLMTQCIALLVTAPILHVRAAEDATGQQKVRPAAVAGAFYPADPKELSQMIDDMLAKATPPPVDGEILAAVAPHAGYPYSGPVAAWTYAALKGHKYSRVVVIAPSHYVAFDFTSVYDGDAYTTPLGQVPVDKEFARRLAKMSSTIRALRQRPPGNSRRSRALGRGRAALAAKNPRQLRAGADRHGRPELREQPRAGRGPGQDAAQRSRHAGFGQLRSLPLPLPTTTPRPSTTKPCTRSRRGTT